MRQGDRNGGFKEENALVEKCNKFIQIKTISIIVKSSWGALQTLHSLQTSLLCSPTPSDALASTYTGGVDGGQRQQQQRHTEDQ